MMEEYWERRQTANGKIYAEQKSDPPSDSDGESNESQKSDEDCIEDVFDGSHYRALTEKLVSWNGIIQKPARKYFQDRTDIALGLTTDGVPLYKRSRLDAWPVLITNFSLPPEVRTREGYQMCCGIIPGGSEMTGTPISMFRTTLFH